MRHIERSENYWIGSKEPLEDGIYEERPVPDENAKRCHTCEHGYWKYYHYRVQGSDYRDRYKARLCGAMKATICKHGFIQPEEFSQ
jgi:hypothetical protein